ADDNHFSDVHDIHVEDIRCDKVNNAAIVLQGTKAKPLQNISFRNVVVKECKVGFSASNTEPVQLQDCHLGGTINTAPSTASKKDKVFDKPIQNL
ncbi:MAG: glycoside hydrolase family 28 protein, partial [Bacteroidales bacterium]|nr:glycoside hydrolase family 28 protein [Bacteroidales bacterium]